MNLLQLQKIMPLAKSRAALFYQPLVAAMAEFGINTPIREAAFLAQIGHESGQLRFLCELDTGESYEGRKDLGNSAPGDGVRYKGRGLIQITGKANYINAMLALDVDCVTHPELLETPVNAARSAAWFWYSRGLNTLADNGMFTQITRRINGGLNGLAHRQELYATAKHVLMI